MRLWVASLILVSCTAGELAAACEVGFQAFLPTVYAKVRRDCALCHDGSKVGMGAPPFATDDPNSSYQQLLNYMNFTNINESLLVIRAGNNHCGESNCNPASGADMLIQAQA